ncbi:DUF6056 family protein [Limosilactobacillus reuteri]|uniref:DUF6056 family protein n=1 Tax=Limosilactobacillus reuteri TaxID=1598 RepID=UPI002551D699|nr:DUF6056 family protein [Limosilactobacillus reuteri]MDL2058276.1 DUF6056 family protein [Limosilactobacillus reuteri]
MNLEINNKKWTRILLCVYLIVMFMFIFLWSYKTPFYNDDLFFSSNHASISSLLASGVDDYFMSNGRFFGQTFTRIILSRGVMFSSVCTGIEFVLLLIILLNLTNTIKANSVYLDRLVITTVSVILFVPGFASVFIWRAGVGNYLMTAVIEMLLLLIVYKRTKRDNKLVAVVAALVGFVAGWGNENTSGGIILICLLLILKKYLVKDKVPIKLICGTLGLIFGYLMLIFAPGGKKRAQLNDNAYLHQNFLKRLYEGFERQISFFYSDVWIVVFLSLLIIVIVTATIFWKNNPTFLDGIIFIIGGLASGIVMILAPEGMDTGRTYLGTTLLLIVGILLLIPLRIEDKGLRCVYISTVLVLTLICFFNVVIGIRESRNINSQILKRYNYILHDNHKVVKVKPIEFENNKYTLSSVYAEVKETNDISTFPNNCYYRYFNKVVRVQK